MRAMRELRSSVDKVTAGMVSQALFAAFQQAQKETDDRLTARLQSIETTQEEQRKERARQWFAIVMAIVSGVVSLGVALILKGTP
jgi:fatty acid desaturase